MPYVVYALCAPRFPLMPRYVGMTRDPVQRLQIHRPTKCAGRLLSGWLAEIKAKPFIVVLESCDDEETARGAETAWIRTLVNAGCDLLNTQGNPEVHAHHDTKLYTYNGRAMYLAEWAAHLNIDRERLRQRLMNMPVEVALSFRKGETSQALEQFIQQRREAGQREEVASLRAAAGRRGLTLGERRHRRRLMADAYYNGRPLKAVATDFGVTEHTVRLAVKEFRDEPPDLEAWKQNLGLG